MFPSSLEVPRSLRWKLGLLLYECALSEQSIDLKKQAPATEDPRKYQTNQALSWIDRLTYCCLSVDPAGKPHQIHFQQLCFGISAQPEPADSPA